MRPYLLPLLLCVSIVASAQRNRFRSDETAENYYKKQAYAGNIHLLASDKAPDSCLVRAGEQLNYLASKITNKQLLSSMTEKLQQVVVMGRYEGITQLPEFKDYPGMEPWWDIHKR